MIRELRPKYPKLPVIVITGHRDEQTRQRALAEGAAVVLYKPLDPNDLFHALYSAMSDSEKDI